MPRLNNPRHLLIVASTIAHAKLIADTLEIAKFASTYQVATTAATYLSLWQEKTYDAIVWSDCSRNEEAKINPLNGKMEEMLKYLEQDCWIFLISGQLRDEITVKFMNAGISNSKLKSTLFNLADVLQGMIDAAATKNPQQCVNPVLIQEQDSHHPEPLLEQINEILTATVTPQETFQQLVKQIGQSFGVDRVTLSSLEDEQVVIKQEWRVNPQIPSLLGCPRNLESQQLLTSDSNSQKPDHSQNTSFLSAPIYLDGQVVSYLDLYTIYEHRNFTAQEIKTAKFVAQQVAIAWQQALNYQRIKQLELANQELDKYSHDTIAFLDHTSHELRTPLTGIIGFSRLLGEQIYGPLNDKQMQYVAALSNCGEHLLELVNDLLDLSRIDAGREQLYLEVVPVEDVCRGALSLVQQPANQSGLELKLEMPPVITVCKADKRRLKQILVNLLSNGVKYTECGSVTLQVEQDEHYMYFKVIDTGIGMNQEEQKFLFEPFHRINTPEHRKRPGTGLGLALSLKLAQLHGGDITVTSQPGKGSCFTLHLPNY